MKLVRGLLIFIVSIFLFFVVLSVLSNYFSRIECSPNYFIGETTCRKKFPFPFAYEGELNNYQREGFGTFSTTDFQYKGKWVNDKFEGRGEMKFFPTILDPYEGIIQSESWENGDLSGVSSVTLHFNSTHRIEYKGMLENIQFHGKGELTGYGENDRVLFHLSESIFQSGRLFIEEEEEEENTDYNPTLTVFVEGKFEEIKIDTFVDEFRFSSGGYFCHSLLTHSSFMGSTARYQWNGKRLELLETKREENDDDDDIDEAEEAEGIKNNMDFLIYLTEIPLTSSLVMIREFELYFLMKTMTLLNTKVSFREEMEKAGMLSNNHAAADDEIILDELRKKDDEENEYISL